MTRNALGRLGDLVGRDVAVRLQGDRVEPWRLDPVALDIGAVGRGLAGHLRDQPGWDNDEATEDDRWLCRNLGLTVKLRQPLLEAALKVVGTAAGLEYDFPEFQLAKYHMTMPHDLFF